MRRFLVRTDPMGRRRLAHLHLMRPNEPRWGEQLAFRNRLRADPALVTEHAVVKTLAAVTHRTDREAYTIAKASFICRAIGPPPAECSDGSDRPG